MRFKIKRRNQIVLKYLNLKSYEIDWEAESKSKFQKRVKDLLFPYWNKHIVYEECPVAGSRMAFDFFNATKRIVVECQGKQHNDFMHYWHGDHPANFLAQLRRDMSKQDFCELNDITFIEILEDDELSEELLEKLNLI